MLDESWKLISPKGLSWSDADPSRHVFDPAEAAEVVRSLAAPAPDPALPRDQLEAWCDAVSHALVAHYGRWACGWSWSVGEGSWDGGPVGAWCCASHSLREPEQTLARVAASLVEWRQWLERLDEKFRRWLPPPEDGPDEELLTWWEVAVVQLVNATIDQTRTESGWHGHCAQVLGWFLEAAGISEDRRAALISTAIGGRFDSWVAPSAVVIDAIAEQLAESLVPGMVRRPDADLPEARAHQMAASHRQAWELRPIRRTYRKDSLSLWLANRAEIGWSIASRPVTGPIVGRPDAIAEYCAAREPALTAALTQVRADATARSALSFPLLAEWQCTVLGVSEAPFRTGPALAKQGRESYHWRRGLDQTFAACVAEADDSSIPLPSRAARVYLDVLFFHPFADGNARSALLALAFVLAREDIVLDRIGPIVKVARPAHDKLAAASLAGLVEVLINTTASHNDAR